MADIAFTADRSIPGLGASDLARRAVNIVSTVYSGMWSEIERDRAQFRFNRDLRGLDVRTLRDIGLDNSSF